MPCTTILVGKKASYDGSTMVARNEDSGANSYDPKKFIVINKDNQKNFYKSVISKVEIELPKNPMRYTCVPNAIKDEGIWGACGVNELNVTICATETITSNERVLGADPLVKYIKSEGKKGEKNYKEEKFGGIGEEDILTIVLPYIKSAKDGVKRLGELLEKYGTYEMNGIAFQDVNEIWYLETIGGHHWIARKVPDDCYVIMSNQFGIDFFDFEDAFGKQKEYMCSKDLKDFIKKYNLGLEIENKFNPRLIFGSNTDTDKVYNTPRVWISQKYLNKNINDLEFSPNSNNFSWCKIPDKKITIEDVKYILSNHFQGTKYDPYSKNENENSKGKFRPIGINRTNFLGLTQVRPYMKDSIKTIKWLSFGSNVFNAIIPFYTNIENTPKYFSNTTNKVTTENFYWINRIIAVISDSHFSSCKAHIKRYQLELQSKCYEIIHKYDKIIEKENFDDKKIKEICEKANNEIEKEVKFYTEDLLNKVLFTSSNEMKNSFSLSDF